MKLNNKIQRNTNRNERGFSLLELLVVVAIMLVIAAIAIPAFAKARRAANEAAAISALKSIVTAEATYETAWGNGFGPMSNLAATGGTGPDSCDSANILPDYMASGTWSAGGYDFTFTKGDTAYAPKPANCTTVGVANYTVKAVPHSLGDSGVRAFFVDQTGVVRYDAAGVAPLAADPALGQ